MCLTIPGRIISIDGKLATVDYGGEGVRENINISMVLAKIGSYILVQGGIAVKILNDQEAEETLQVWKTVQAELED